MKIPWIVVILTSAGVILLTWHLRTRHLDYLSPDNTPLPPEDFGLDLAAGSATLQPPIEKETPADLPIPPPEDDPQDTPTVTEISEADLGDLDASPGLGTYRENTATFTPARLFLLSSTLRIRGEFQRALLALERIVDSTNASPQELLEAGRGIGALTPDLPIWTVDPTAEVPLILELSIPHAASDHLEKTALELTKLIHRHSGGQLAVVPRIKSAENPTSLDNPPIAIWLSSTSDPPVSSTVLTMTPSGDSAALLDELARAAFQVVRSHLTRLDYPSPVDLEADGRELLTQQITRLMWRDFARSLDPTPTPVQPPESETGSEDSDEEEN